MTSLHCTCKGIAIKIASQKKTVKYLYVIPASWGNCLEKGNCSALKQRTETTPGNGASTGAGAEGLRNDSDAVSNHFRPYDHTAKTAI